MRLRTFRADETGFARAVLDVSGERCGQFIQMVDLATCGTSGRLRL